MASTLLDLHVTASGGYIVVKVGGEIDMASAPELRECLYHTIDAGSRQLVVDLRQVSFIDSMGLGVLVGAKRRLREHGYDDGSVLLVGADGLVLRAFRLSGLDRVFPCMPPWPMPSAVISARPGSDPARARISRSPSLPDAGTDPALESKPNMAPAGRHSHSTGRNQTEQLVTAGLSTRLALREQHSTDCSGRSAHIF